MALVCVFALVYGVAAAPTGGPVGAMHGVEPRPGSETSEASEAATYAVYAHLASEPDAPPANAKELAVAKAIATLAGNAFAQDVAYAGPGSPPTGWPATPASLLASSAKSRGDYGDNGAASQARAQQVIDDQMTNWDKVWDDFFLQTFGYNSGSTMDTYSFEEPDPFVSSLNAEMAKDQQDAGHSQWGRASQAEMDKMGWEPSRDIDAALENQHDWSNSLKPIMRENTDKINDLIKAMMGTWFDKMKVVEAETSAFVTTKFKDIKYARLKWPIWIDDMQKWPRWTTRIEELAAKQHFNLQQNIKRDIVKQKEDDKATMDEIYEQVHPNEKKELKALNDERFDLWDKYNNTKDDLKYAMKDWAIVINAHSRAMKHSWRQWRNTLNTVGATDDHIEAAANRMNAYKREADRAIAKSDLWIGQANIAMQEEIDDMVAGHTMRGRKQMTKIDKELRVDKKKEPKVVAIMTKEFEKDMTAQERNLKSVTDTLNNAIRRIAKQDIYKPMGMAAATAAAQMMKVKSLDKLQGSSDNLLRTSQEQLTNIFKALDSTLETTNEDVKQETVSEAEDISSRILQEQKLARKRWGQQRQRALEDAESGVNQDVETKLVQFKAMERRGTKISRQIKELLDEYTKRLDTVEEDFDFTDNSFDEIQNTMTAKFEGDGAAMQAKLDTHEESFDDSIARLTSTVDPNINRGVTDLASAKEAVDYYSRRYAAMLPPENENTADRLETMSKLTKYYDDQVKDSEAAMKRGIQETAATRLSQVVQRIDALMTTTTQSILTNIGTQFHSLRTDTKRQRDDFTTKAGEQYQDLLEDLDTIDADKWSDPMNTLMQRVANDNSLHESTLLNTLRRITTEKNELKTAQETRKHGEEQQLAGMKLEAQGVETDWNQFHAEQATNSKGMQQTAAKLDAEAAGDVEVVKAEMGSAQQQVQADLAAKAAKAKMDSWATFSAVQDTYHSEMNNVNKGVDDENGKVNVQLDDQNSEAKEALKIHKKAMVALKADQNSQRQQAQSVMSSVMRAVEASDKSLELSAIASASSLTDQKLALKQRSDRATEAIEQMYGSHNTALSRDMQHAVETSHAAMEKQLEGSKKTQAQLLAAMEAEETKLTQTLATLHRDQVATEREGAEFKSAMVDGFSAVSGSEAKASSELLATDSAEKTGGTGSTEAATEAISEGAGAAEKVMSIIGQSKGALSDTWLDLSSRYHDKMEATRVAAKAAEKHVSSQLGLVNELVAQASGSGGNLEKQLQEHATNTEVKLQRDKTMLMQQTSQAASELRGEQDNLRASVVAEQTASGTEVQQLAGQLVDVADRFNASLTAAEQRTRDAEAAELQREIDLLKVGAVESEHTLDDTSAVLEQAQHRDMKHMTLQRGFDGFKAKQLAWNGIVQRQFAQLGLEVGQTAIQGLHQEEMEAAEAKREADAEKREAQTELSEQERILNAKLAGVYTSMDAQISHIMGDATMTAAERDAAIKRIRADADRQAKALNLAHQERRQQQLELDAGLERYRELVSQARDMAEAAVASGHLGPSALAVHDELVSVTDRVNQLKRHPWVLPSATLQTGEVSATSEKALENENERLKRSNAEVEAAINAAEERLDEELGGPEAASEPQLRGAAV